MRIGELDPCEIKIVKHDPEGPPNLVSSSDSWDDSDGDKGPPKLVWSSDSDDDSDGEYDGDESWADDKFLELAASCLAARGGGHTHHAQDRLFHPGA